VAHTEEPGIQARGAFPSFKAVLANLIEAGKNRLALFANEVAEARLRLVEVFALSILMLALLVLGICAGLGFIAVLFWESRLLVLGLAACAFFLFAALCLWRVAVLVRRGSKLFEASLAELDTDARLLRGEAAPVARGAEK
jgi:uncharacterized membrane protein YqjE